MPRFPPSIRASLPQPYPDLVCLYPSVKWGHRGFPAGLLPRLCLWKGVRSERPPSAPGTLVGSVIHCGLLVFLLYFGQLPGSGRSAQGRCRRVCGGGGWFLSLFLRGVTHATPACPCQSWAAPGPASDLTGSSSEAPADGNGQELCSHPGP